MDAQAFTNVLLKPSLLKKYSFNVLESLTQLHPYASLFSAMIAKKAFDEKNSSYEHYLNRAAIRVPDRKRLYHFIHSPAQEIVEEILKIPEPTNLPDDTNINIQKEVVPIDVKMPADSESLIEISMPEENEGTVIKKAEETNERSEDGVGLELPGSDEVVEALKTIKDPGNLQNELDIRIDEEKDMNEHALSGKHSFLDWLSLIRDNQEKQKRPLILKQIQESSEKDEIKFTKDRKLSEGDEAFLSRKAKESLSDDLEWVTETLAKIYELQKKYDKAQEAYQMLSLKYPDKKAYFAQRIENLKRKLNK